MFAGDDFKISAKASSTLGKPADSVRSDTALKASSPYPSAGSSNAPSPGSAAAADWPRIGNASTARRSPSCASPPFASCCETYAIPRDVLGQTLRRRRQGTEDHCNAGGEHCGSCEPTNSLSPVDDLFDQHHYRQTSDPGQVHDPEDEKERHQHRAAAETIEAVRQPETRGAEESRPPQPHEERERRAAFLETGGFERGQLIEGGRHQKRPSDASVAECEPHVGNRARSHEGPLDQGCERGEAAPDCEIEAGEHGRRREDPALLAAAAREFPIEQDHGR